MQKKKRLQTLYNTTFSLFMIKKKILKNNLNILETLQATTFYILQKKNNVLIMLLYRPTTGRKSNLITL